MSVALPASQLLSGVGGAVVFWTASPSDRDLINQGLEALGLPFRARQRTDASALRGAMQEYGKNNVAKAGVDALVKGHKRQDKNGYELVAVGLDEQQNQYEVAFGAKVDNGQVVISTIGINSLAYAGTASRQRIQDGFEKRKGQCPAISVSNLLVDVLSYLGGIRLRQAGGVYFVPKHSLEMFGKVAQVVESAGATRIERMTTVIDEPTVRAVTAALTDEINTATESIQQDLADGLTLETIERRKGVAEQLYKKVTDYQELLGEPLYACQAAVRATQQAITIAALSQMEGGITV